ncbi:MAG TPA: MoxR family ATPase [Gammaproteobacteria bacterium]|nr:MoxR family ATPase [Gammaproteobacteria bacterium]
MHRPATTSPEREPPHPASLAQVVEAIGEIILGKEQVIRLALTCLLARGHLLLEDLPGVGKTTLAHVLARALGLEFHRIQFTSDMLPADILGVSVYDQASAAFKFHPGPIFTQVVLADEVNRATPKAQSALLEAMEEHQVTTEGETHPLPQPFFVIATQNPTHQIGTFPLPESQLDRFLMRLQVGYPDDAAERALLKGRDRRHLLREMTPVLDPDTLMAIQARVPEVHASDALVDYIQALLAFSRQSPLYRSGLSPRAGLALLRCAQAWALLAGRDHVLPEDVQAVLPAVAEHRLQAAVDQGVQDSGALVATLLRSVAIP